MGIGDSLKQERDAGILAPRAVAAAGEFVYRGVNDECSKFNLM
jgi:hypothetical protein